jgi:hypothetical protein
LDVFVGTTKRPSLRRHNVINININITGYFQARVQADSISSETLFVASVH